jgi:hypothetical protein
VSIRAVDMMITYAKASDVEKAQQAEQQQGRVAQQQIAAEEVKNKEIKQTQVQLSNKEEESGRIQEHPERKRGKKPAGRGRQAEQPEEDAEKKQKPTKMGSHPGAIDIRI